ncbi:MAG: tail fiber domain-containing protein [Candidatus Saccharibacteria bacterium]|nr:tail fiber domain-containing protein [Candidatus Saccharibacteria bacterium]
MNIRNKTLSPQIILFILLIGFISFAIFSTNRTYAAPKPLNPSEKAAAYQAASGLAECSSKQGYTNTKVTGSVLNEGLVFNNQARDFAVSVGLIAPGMANADGLLGCSNGPQVSAALQQLGQKGEDYFVDLGIYIPNAGGNGYALKTNTSDEERAKSIKDYFKKKFGLSLDSNLPEASQYFNLKATFLKKCNAGVSTGAAGRSVKIVDTKGVLTDVKYELRSLDISHRVGFGMDKDGGNDNKMECGTIVDQMNAYALAAANEQKKAIDAGANEGTSGLGASGAGADATEDDSCEGQSGVTGWFGCPIINIIGSTTTWIDDQVQNLMVLQPDQYKENPGLKAAWTGFRNIALTLLVAAMMIIVISTALGLSFLDAYTVKKAFPKLIASIIFILLSWWLCILLIDVTTSIGQGLLGIMQAPFGDIGTENISTLFTVNGSDGALQGGALFVGTVSIFATTGALGIVGTWLGGALLVLLMAFVTLIARQMFIIVLILFAPLAILAWIFPGSAKAWQFWWSNFTKLLLMYPMVMALIGAGRIFAFTAADSFTGLYGTIIKLTAYVIPYALIPFTFKAAGGVFGAVASKIQDTGRPGLDRLRKRRQKGYAQMGRNAKTGDLIRGGRSEQGVIGRLNRGVSGLATGTRGRFGIGTRGATQRQNNLTDISGEAAKNPSFQSFLTRDGEAANVMGNSGGTAAGGREAANDMLRGQMDAFDRQNPGATAQERDEFEATQTARFDRAYQAAAVQGFSRTNAAAANANVGANRGAGIANGDVRTFERGIARLGGTAAEQENNRNAAAYGLRGAMRMDIGGNLGDAAANPESYRARRNAYKDASDRMGAAAMVTNADSAAATRDIVRTDAARVATMDPTMSDVDRADSFTFGHELVTGLYQGSIGEGRDAAIGMLQDLGIDPDEGQVAVTEALAQHFGFTADPATAGTVIDPVTGRVAEYIDPTMRSRTSSQPTTSDRRLKKEIKYLYTNDSGIKVYRYKYLWSEVEYVGVIAQEIAKQYPEAVTVDKWGYYKVYYSRINIEFVTYAEFKKRSSVAINSEIKS